MGLEGLSPACGKIAPRAPGWAVCTGRQTEHPTPFPWRWTRAALSRYQSEHRSRVRLPSRPAGAAGRGDAPQSLVCPPPARAAGQAPVCVRALPSASKAAACAGHHHPRASMQRSLSEQAPPGDLPKPGHPPFQPQRDQRDEALLGGLGLGGDWCSPRPSRHPAWILKRPQLKTRKSGMGKNPGVGAQMRQEGQEHVAKAGLTGQPKGLDSAL